MKIEDDGLQIPEVGAWAKEKYDHVQMYCSMFTKAMQPPKWQYLVYIDLFSCAGYARIRETTELVMTSALLSMDIPNQFNRYIFCDIDCDKNTVLKTRVSKHFPDTDSHFICGDVNNSVPQILSLIPSANTKFKVLGFCFVDPYKLDNLAFSTLEMLSKRFMDFMVLIPTDMDANRNVANYTDVSNNIITKFTGKKDWRTRWASTDGQSFGLFVLNEFSTNMQKLNYKPIDLHDSVLVRNQKKNAPLYRLALYSRNDLGNKFWKETKKYNNPQYSLFD